MQPRILEVRTKILKKNDELARDLRQDFARAGVLVTNVVSGPGAGKTELLTRTLGRLGPVYRTAAVVGDLATENDARRLATSGAPVKQILTGTMCHLEAQMVRGAIGDWDLSALDVLFIENVGNLVCPASFDLGEDVRVLLFAVTEGEDKPLKYPTLINTADLVVVSKIDLAAAVGFDRELALANIQQVRPGIEVLEVSARTGQGIDAWIEYLRQRREGKRNPSTQVSVGGNRRRCAAGVRRGVVERSERERSRDRRFGDRQRSARHGSKRRHHASKQARPASLSALSKRRSQEMHLGNGAITPQCGLVALGVATVGARIALASARGLGLDRARARTAGAFGAAVFAAQLFNVPILPFSSVHLIGGVLLAWVLGPALGLLTMIAVLTLQSLLLLDGGLLALGANIVNMGVVPALAVVALRRFAPAARSGAHSAVLLALTSLLSTLAGAALIVLEVAAGRSAMQLDGISQFAAWMLGAHALAGSIEGVATVGAAALLVGIGQRRERGVRLSGSAAGLVAAASVAVALLASLGWASSKPDGYQAALAAVGQGGHCAGTDRGRRSTAGNQFGGANLARCFACQAGSAGSDADDDGNLDGRRGGMGAARQCSVAECKSVG